MFRIVPVQYAGREERFAVPFFRTLDEAAEDCAQQVLQAADGKPFAFFGHSFGALLAYRTARLLRATGRPLPFHLLVSGAAAPGVVRRSSGMAQADDEEVLRRIADLTETLPAALDDPDFREILLPPFRADVELHESHPPMIHDPLPISVTTLLGKHDPLVTEAQALRWTEVATAAHRFLRMPGGHMYLADNWERFWRTVEEALVTATKPPVPSTG